MYAIIDVETSGMGATNNKITDIAIIIHDGQKIIDEFQSLVNPERKISRRVTQLTGIDNEMVKYAPKFYEIAKQVYQMTEDLVFVAHNVSFDYNVIKGEFEALGGTFIRKQLCTVRTARRLIPGSKSYSLGNICEDLNIEITQRHRAYGDALATAKLFDILLDKSKEEGNSLWPPKKATRKASIPPLLPRKIYDELPTLTGVYYFHDTSGKVIYVGKAKNIKQRVLSHFHDKSKKELRLCEQTANITYQITGSELVALLLESAEIKEIQPKYNHSQKRLNEAYGIQLFENRKGILELCWNKLDKLHDPLITFYTQGQAERFMRSFASTHTLCHRYTGLEKTKSGCFASRIKTCNGVCCEQENISTYNKRVNKAIQTLDISKREFIIIDNGRDADENALIHVNKLGYQGFGFIPKDETITNFEEFLPYIINKPNNSDSQRIIRSFLFNGNVFSVADRKDFPMLKLSSW